MKHRARILLFIPGYNCERQIVRVLNQLDDQILGYIDHVIVVNNRSTDHTEQAVIEWMGDHRHIPATLLRNDENYGLGGSHKVAFEYAMSHGFEYVIVLHGDDQGSIRDILPVLSGGTYTQYDCCLGARFMKGSALQGYSGFRTFGNRVYNLLFSLVCGIPVKDLGSGLKLYSTEMLKNRFYIKFPDDLTFDYCMVMSLSQYKQTHCFFPITWREDDQVSNVKLFSQAKKVLDMLFGFSIGRERFLQKEMRRKPVLNYTAKAVTNNHDFTDTAEQ